MQNKKANMLKQLRLNHETENYLYHQDFDRWKNSVINFGKIIFMHIVNGQNSSNNFNLYKLYCLEF